jgi:hypothetical protein
MREGFRRRRRYSPIRMTGWGRYRIDATLSQEEYYLVEYYLTERSRF